MKEIWHRPFPNVYYWWTVLAISKGVHCSIFVKLWGFKNRNRKAKAEEMSFYWPIQNVINSVSVLTRISVCSPQKLRVIHRKWISIWTFHDKGVSCFSNVNQTWFTEAIGIHTLKLLRLFISVKTYILWVQSINIPDVPDEHKTISDLLRRVLINISAA